MINSMPILMANNLLSTHQSGFRSLHSTVTSLLEATDDWAFNIDQGNVNAVVFLDLKKAFDTVDHNILISKLSAYGIRGTSIEWFKSYLSERNQKCFINGSLSSNSVLSCGIPQGTILGPLLFLLYINDLPNCVMHSQPRMYADDTHLTLAGNSVDSIELNLNEDLASISEWLTANKLTLNKSKTEFMIIGSRQRLKTLPHSPSLKIDGAPISQGGGGGGPSQGGSKCAKGGLNPFSPPGVPGVQIWTRGSEQSTLFNIVRQNRMGC